jgi:hypothetical protein
MAKQPTRPAVSADAPDAEPWSGAGSIHRDLLAVKTLVYEANGFTCSPPVPEPESAEYAAYELTLNGSAIRFRAAKITPTKLGQFVTVWKRSKSGPIRPFDTSDCVDFFVISTRDGAHFGQFVFPQRVLCEHDIVSSNAAGGKRAFRVYPPWVTPTSRQAQRTQAWQLDYFLHIHEDDLIDPARCRTLYAL